VIWTNRRAWVVGVCAAVVALIASLVVGVQVVTVLQTRSCPVGDPPPPCPQQPPVTSIDFSPTDALLTFAVVFLAVVLIASIALWRRGRPAPSTP
jgi:hypothetical protein